MFFSGNKILLTLLIGLVFLTGNAQVNFEWVKNAGGPTGDYSRSVATDNEGYIYITGEFSDTVHFDDFELNSDYYDMYVAKYRNSGMAVWVRQASASTDIFSSAVTTDSENNVYVTGFFLDTAYFEDTMITCPALDYSVDIYTAKYTNAGELLWVRHAGGENEDKSYQIASDTDDNIYVIGQFRETMIADEDTITAPIGAHAIFILKYDKNGNKIWLKIIKSLNMGCCHGKFITTDNQNNYYISGNFENNIDFTDTVLYLEQGNCFFAKYDHNDNFQWARQAPYGNFHSIVCDEYQNVYIGGQFYGTTNFGDDTLTSNGISDIFISRYNSAGDLQWIRQAGGIGDDGSYSITSNDNNNFIITGNFYGKAWFEEDSVTAFNNYDVDMFIADYDSTGDMKWLKSFGGPGDDESKSITTDDQSNIYLTGCFYNGLLYDSDTLIGYGNKDIFLARIHDSIVNINMPVEDPDLFILYPNPARDLINIGITGINTKLNLDIYNISGTNVLKRQINAINGNTVQVNLKGLSKGLYILRVYNTNTTYTGKLVIY